MIKYSVKLNNLLSQMRALFFLLKELGQSPITYLLVLILYVLVVVKILEAVVGSWRQIGKYLSVLHPVEIHNKLILNRKNCLVW